MIIKMLKRDFLRKKIISAAVFTFIMMSAVLFSSGTNMFIDLSNSLDYLIKEASAPHFVKYHSGNINQQIIEDWSETNPLVKLQQTSEMINVEGSKIYLNNSNESEVNSVMEMAFVKQNLYFDYLVDLNNIKIIVRDGEIAVPIFYMQKNDLEIGDIVQIKDENTELTFTITDFVRDVQMNPSIISSKRFVVSESDFKTLKNSFGEIEYLISFQLHDLKDLSEFTNQYGSSNLPQKGPSIDYELLKTLNSVTDGLIAAVIIFISMLLNTIALLCLRFTILSTIEEDYREIGVMKAIGILPYQIKRIYITKYFFLAFSASIAGYILSIFLNHEFSKNIMLYIGEAPKSLIQTVLPLCSALAVFIIVLAFCMLILKRFEKISAIEAIRMGNTGETYRSTKRLALHRRSHISPNVYLGLRDVILRLKLYSLLFLVFILCTFIIIVPLNFINSIQSPDSVKYMGIGKSDIFIDLRQSDNIIERFDEMVGYVKNDPDVVRFAPFITCQYEVINKDGYEESLTVETGDFSVFPLEYIEGLAPKLDNEIALSFLSASELEKRVGDEVELKMDGTFKTMIVSGIYQDITNGGRTAKAGIKPNHDRALWYTIRMDVNKDVTAKIHEYKNFFDEAKITDIEGYLQQTFNNTISQLKLLTILAIVLVILIAILITSLFLKMLIAKDVSQIAIMRSIGITLRDIRIQYITKSLTILSLGIIIGTIISNILGEKILSVVLTVIGACKIELVVNPLNAYVLTPVVLITIVTITTLISISSIKQFCISDINQE